MKPETLIVYSFLFVASISCAENIENVKENYRDGRSYIEQENYLEATKSCKMGIELLGNTYYPNEEKQNKLRESGLELIDDTGMKIAIGRANQKKGEFKYSAHLFCNSLESRILIYEKYK